MDLLIMNAANTKAVTLQVKFSKDFLPSMILPKLDANGARAQSRLRLG